MSDHSPADDTNTPPVDPNTQHEFDVDMLYVSADGPFYLGGLQQCKLCKQPKGSAHKPRCPGVMIDGLEYRVRWYDRDKNGHQQGDSQPTITEAVTEAAGDCWNDLWNDPTLEVFYRMPLSINEELLKASNAKAAEYIARQNQEARKRQYTEKKRIIQNLMNDGVIKGLDALEALDEQFKDVVSKHA